MKNALLLVLLISVIQTASAQQRFMVKRGEIVSPAYEGWWPNEERGGYTLFFGYMNSNWEQQFDIPVGPDNYFSHVGAGELDDLTRDGFDMATADMGQPTHFYPRRNPFLFTVDVPGDFGTGEIVWTLRSQGQTNRAYGSLKPDYRIDPQVISTEVGGAFGSLDGALRGNIPPELEVRGDNFRRAVVGEAISLAVYASDPDNLPARAERPIPATAEQIYRPPASIVVMSGPGLRFSWTVYRGEAANVTFAPPQFKTYTDSRAWANSPWSPPYIIPPVPQDNLWQTTATFSEPGEYILRGIASDGSLFTYQNLTVTVME